MLQARQVVDGVVDGRPDGGASGQEFYQKCPVLTEQPHVGNV